MKEMPKFLTLHQAREGLESEAKTLGLPVPEVHSLRETRTAWDNLQQKKTEAASKPATQPTIPKPAATPKPAEPKAPESVGSLPEQYASLSTPQERDAFRRKHMAELQKDPSAFQRAIDNRRSKSRAEKRTGKPMSAEDFSADDAPIEEKPLSSREFVEQYTAIKSPQERDAFRRKHAEAFRRVVDAGG